MAAFSRRAVVALAGWAFLCAGGGWQSACRGDDAIPADAPPRWWKGNLHTHTLWSDGDDFPEMVAEWYRTHGYHFLALSDHNVLGEGIKWMKAGEVLRRGGPAVIDKYRQRFGDAWLERRGGPDPAAEEIRLKPLSEYRALVEERGKFLLLAAEEISDTAEGVPVHMNASNLAQQVAPLGGPTVREAIENNLRNVEDQARRLGREMLVHLNHPNFGYAVTAEDLAHAVSERFFEVYNGHPGVNQPGDPLHPSVERLWDIANTLRLLRLNAPPLYGIATDDSHQYHDQPKGARPGRGWLMVRSTHLTPEYLIRAIKAGDCYASSGVVLADVAYDASERALRLAIEPVPGATFVTHFVGTLRDADTSSEETRDEKGNVPLNRQGKPLRLTRKYGEQIGRVLAIEQGLAPSYTFRGQELYVRAVVTSSQEHPNPSIAGQRQQAWTQPVGWEGALKPVASEP